MRRRRCGALNALKNPVLVVSLDFELHWGVRDHLQLEAYKENLLGVRKAIPALLKLLEQYGIHATWATVGFLFCSDQQEMLASAPVVLPRYSEPQLSPYQSFAQVGANEADDPFHFAPSLISMIAKSPHQEIGTHTFSHYYCLEPGQDPAAFRADLEAALRLAAQRQFELRSIVFPRNQYSREYLKVCSELGITVYRGNEASWIYAGRSWKRERALRRALRLADAYVNLTGDHCFVPSVSEDGVCNIPSSRFLRPYAPRARWLEGLRLRRILGGLNAAARRNQAYHLWWHPHNFGTYLDENMAFLEKILAHFASLRRSHGMESLNMSELAARAAASEPVGASA
jgi:peptidoglycan/xylan/chitin deacetylase (PgdA/CDA1 family)